MKASDLLISGGGSFLHEADFELHGRSFLLRGGKLRPVPYFLSVVLMARSCGLPVMWYAQGLGPLHTRSARRLVARAASVSQAVTWRDPDSARLAYEIGVRGPVQEVVPDPAYALTPASPEQAQAELQGHGLTPGTRYLAVCPRPWLGRTGYLDALGEALEKAGEALDLEVLLVPFHEIQDPSVCETLAARPGFAGRAHVLPPVDSPALLAAVLGGAEMVVAMRLHSGILAATAGTPAVVIDYDPKTRAFAAQTGQSAWAVRGRRPGGRRLRRRRDRRLRVRAGVRVSARGHHGHGGPSACATRGACARGRPSPSRGGSDRRAGRAAGFRPRPQVSGPTEIEGSDPAESEATADASGGAPSDPGRSVRSVVGKAALVIVAATLVGRLLGLAREAVMPTSSSRATPTRSSWPTRSPTC